MARYLIFNGQRFTTYLFYLLCVLLMSFAWGCGNESSDLETSDHVTPASSDTGSASFTIQWHAASNDPDRANAMVIKAIENCSAAGVETITCEVYDESNNPIASGGPWPCDARSGRIERIPAGANRTFAVLGWNSTGGDIVYQGNTTSGIDINPGVIADAGTIDAYEFVPTGLGANAISTSQIDLTWEDLGVAGYRIYRNGEAIDTSVSPSYSNNDLSQNTQYCYTVSAYDGFGNESGQSEQACATTEASVDTEAPEVPTGIEAGGAVSVSQIDLSWTASTDNVGVTGYRIYRDGTEAGTSASPSFSDMTLTSSTEYCYTVAAYDAAGNESAQSGQSCATTRQSFNWYHDFDQDGFGNPNDLLNSETQPEGYVSDNTDCDDDNRSINPGAAEVCHDGLDNNCSREIDENCPDCYPDLATPILRLTDRQTIYITDRIFYTIYYLTVTNSAVYPNDMFVVSSEYPVCGEVDGSRTIVEIYDNNDTPITSHCDFTSSGNLESFNFTIYNDSSYPESAYIRIVDQECDHTYVSNLEGMQPAE